MAFIVSACAQIFLVDFQIPGRQGLLTTLRHFETGVKWKNWPLLMESYYLSDHAAEAKKTYGGDLGKWFGADKFTAAIHGNKSEKVRFTCILSLREKHFSPSFEPHFVVYYRIQTKPCQEAGILLSGLIAEGWMEWGFDTNKRRWIHLRKLG